MELVPKDKHQMLCLNNLINYRSEGLPHALFYPGRDWSGVWLRLGGRRLAVPKGPRFGPPPTNKNTQKSN